MKINPDLNMKRRGYLYRKNINTVENKNKIIMWAKRENEIIITLSQRIILYIHKTKRIIFTTTQKGLKANSLKQLLSHD